MKFLSKIVLLITSCSLISAGFAIPLSTQKRVNFTIKDNAISGYVYNQSSFPIFTNALGLPHTVKSLQATGGIAPSFKMPLLPNVDHSQQSFQITYWGTTAKGKVVCNFSFFNNEGKPDTWTVSAFRASGDVVCSVGKQSGIIFLSMDGAMTAQKRR